VEVGVRELVYGEKLLRRDQVARLLSESDRLGVGDQELVDKEKLLHQDQLPA
jgi:hypothetical protein